MPGDRWSLQHVPLNGRFVPWTSIGGPDVRLFDRWQQDRSHYADIRVFVICLECDDEYLLITHAPLGDLKCVEAQVCPDSPEPRITVTVDVPVSGSCWHCAGDEVRALVMEVMVDVAAQVVR